MEPSAFASECALVIRIPLLVNARTRRLNLEQRSCEVGVLNAIRSSSLLFCASFVVCGCQRALVRLFHPATLAYLCTLPKPPPFRPLSAAAPAGTALPRGGGGATAGGSLQEAAWGDAAAVGLTGDGLRAACAYGDGGLFVWDLRDPSRVCR